MSLLIIPIIFLSGLTYGLTGFGSALVAMPLLTPLLGVEVAAPMFALVALAAEFVSLLRYRRHLRFEAVWRLMLASLLALPIGVMLAQQLPEQAVLLLLGVVVGGYGLYNLLRLPLPHIVNPNLAFFFGFASGLLSGAYNTGGPPVVIYTTMARWEPTKFKSTLQGMFMVNSTVVISLHYVNQHITPLVVEGVLIALPVMLIGVWMGWRLDRRINPALFNRIVMALLVLVGLRLILSNLG